MTTSLRRSWGLVVVGAALSLATTGVLAGTAEAASPPSVLTGQPSGIAVDAATVSGDVNPAGLPTSWFFQYGTSTSYGLTSAVGNAGAGVQQVPVAVRIGGLTVGTTYHYRLVAKSSDGSAYGSDASFRTAVLPPTILKTAVSEVRDTTALVSALIVPNGLPTTWSVRYGTAGALTDASATHSAGASVGATGVALRLVKLAPDTTYDIEVVADNAAGQRLSAESSFATTGPPVIAAESVGALSPTSADVLGSLVANGHPTDWYVQYGTTTSYGLRSALAAAGASMTAVSVARRISGLVPNTAYHFRLVATSAAGTVVGADSTFTTPGPTLSSSLGSVTFGRAVVLAGTVPDAAPNEVVSLYDQPVPATSFVQLTTVLTGAGGSWSYSVTPRIDTLYKALWEGEASPTIVVGVSPSVMLRERSGGRFVTHVAGESSFVGRLVRLQRLEHGSWRTISSARLNRGSAVAFRPSLSAGLARLRVYLTAYQAGVGYLAATSAVHVYHAS